MLFAICLTIGTILYGLSDFLKAIVLCLKLKGPPAVPFLGNVLMLQDKDCKLYSYHVNNSIQFNSILIVQFCNDEGI